MNSALIRVVVVLYCTMTREVDEVSSVRRDWKGKSVTAGDQQCRVSGCM